MIDSKWTGEHKSKTMTDRHFHWNFQKGNHFESLPSVQVNSHQQLNERERSSSKKKKNITQNWNEQTKKKDNSFPLIEKVTGKHKRMQQKHYTCYGQLCGLSRSKCVYALVLVDESIILFSFSINSSPSLRTRKLTSIHVNAVVVYLLLRCVFTYMHSF